LIGYCFCAGGSLGDLYVVVHVKPHNVFERDGSDILCEVPVGFAQAALGAEIEVPTLESRAKMKIPAGTQTGTIFRLRGRGLPEVDGYGKRDRRKPIETSATVKDQFS